MWKAQCIKETIFITKDKDPVFEAFNVDAFEYITPSFGGEIKIQFFVSITFSATAKRNLLFRSLQKKHR